MTVVLPTILRGRVEPEIVPDEGLVSGGVRLRRFTLDEYHRLIETGFLHPDEHLELIEGLLVLKADWLSDEELQQESEFLLRTKYPLRRFTVEEYHQLIELGMLEGLPRVELLDGLLIEMSAFTAYHRTCVHQFYDFLHEQVGERAQVFMQSPITLPDLRTEPEPDVVIARSRRDNYAHRHPYSDEVLLVAEVAYSTLESDQTIKGPTYARSGIPEYWLWNLQDWQLEVYREPVTLAIGTAGYRVRTVYLADETIAPLAFPDCPVHVGDILPARLK